MPTKGTAQTCTIKTCGDLAIAASSGHFVNPGNGFLWSLQRAFSRLSPFHPQTEYRARAPTNLHFDLPCFANPIPLPDSIAMRNNCFLSWLVVVSALQTAGRSWDNSVMVSSAVKFHPASRSAWA